MCCLNLKYGGCPIKSEPLKHLGLSRFINIGAGFGNISGSVQKKELGMENPQSYQYCVVLNLCLF